ncbi:hypothetical protein GGR56DRAFT_686095 [Xylariaceae sp. FL0804]|nr:hypothetical protein GGR56DRAFT_686095 [Xylariaceae sp. FL0804]
MASPPPDTADLPHNDESGVLIGVVALVCSIATLAVGLRFYTRKFIVKQLGVDDYLVLTALIIALATGVSQAYNTRNGLGKHIWDVGPIELMNYLQNFYISIALYNTGLMVVKLTFLAQYYRVLAIQKMRTILLVAMAIIGSWSLSQVLVGIFICTPIAGFWNPSLHATCIPNLPQWYINSAGNIATDIAIFIIPLPVLGHLNLPKAQRLVLIGIFSLGFFTCAISVIRIKFLKQGGDLTYENVEGSSWSITELCSGVTCACLPTLRPLASRWVPALSTKLHRSSRSYNYRRQSGSQGGGIAGEDGLLPPPSPAASKRASAASSAFGSSSGSRRALRLKALAALDSKEDLCRLDTESAYQYHLKHGLGRSADSSPYGGGGGGIDDDKSDAILGLKSTRADDSSLYSFGTSNTNSPTSPGAAAHFFPIQVPGRPPVGGPDDSWLRSTVTTSIGANKGPRRSSSLNHSKTTIQVKRDLFMHKSSYSNV